jgi:hypothetical protein
MSPTIGWDEGSPADTESAGLGDDRIRSLKSSVRIGLDSEHVWPSGGGDAGVHRLGSARAYYGTQSLVSSTGTDGRLMTTSDTSRLFQVGSGGTALVGGATAILGGAFPGTVPQRHYWALDAGAQEASTGDQESIAFNSLYSGLPFVTLSAHTTTNKTILLHIRTLGAGSMAVSSYLTAGGFASGHTINWMSLGTRVL